MKIEITVASDPKLVKEIRQAIEDNDGYCPCALFRDADTKCMCKKFRDMFGIKDGWCDCGLYHVTNREKE